MTCERIADLIDLYLDGEADALSARMVEEHLADCPACGRQLAARQALQKALREKLPYHRAPLPLHHHQARTYAWRRAALYPLAAGLLLFAGVLLGHGLRPAPAADPLLAVAQAAEVDHLRSLQEQHLMDVVSTDQHTVKPWFAGRLAFSPAVPDLADFPLRGGRLDWMEGQQAAALVYGRNKHTINLLIWPASSATALPTTPTPRGTPAGHHLVCWSQAGLNFCAISDLEASQLADFATAYRTAAQP